MPAPPASATGSTFKTVSVASSVSDPPLSSVTVRVSLTVPLSLQVTSGSCAVAWSKLHVAPLMNPAPAVYAHDQPNVSLLPTSVAEPWSLIGEPSLPEY